MLSIQSETNKAFSPKPLQREWLFHARDFEKETGFTNIASYFKIPGAHDETELATILRDTAFEGMKWHEKKTYSLSLDQAKKLLDMIVDENPELDQLDINKNDITDIYHTLLGILSGFNVDDINLFVQRESDKKNGHLSDSDVIAIRQIENQKRELLQEQAGASIYWVPSAKTISLIEEQINQRAMANERTISRT